MQRFRCPLLAYKLVRNFCSHGRTFPTIVGQSKFLENVASPKDAITNRKRNAPLCLAPHRMDTHLGVDPWLMMLVSRRSVSSRRSNLSWRTPVTAPTVSTMAEPVAHYYLNQSKLFRHSPVLILFVSFIVFLCSFRSLLHVLFVVCALPVHVTVAN